MIQFVLSSVQSALFKVQQYLTTVSSDSVTVQSSSLWVRKPDFGSSAREVRHLQFGGFYFAAVD